MCGRYIRRLIREDVLKHFDVIDTNNYFENYKPSEEVFPGEPIFAINNKHEAEDVFWTIRDEDQWGKPVRSINARAENVLKISAFKELFLTDRILIPATGLYEWYTPDKGKKVKYEITFSEPIFAFGGFAGDFGIKDKMTRCGVIMTTKSNETFKRIHNIKQRQAVVIYPADYDKWLNPETPLEELKELTQPKPDEETHANEVGEPPKPEAPTLFD
ncbi:MAG TPA: SOS response-associated peptidase family protein [Pyrinomonadaceae bacterium]|jgi:putative SOS response-associated peptidase YedK|nr:SOS response-associated peptidase family protein [Pyrinomonadaceae bacterium]